MDICMVLGEPFPPDIRVSKEAKSLSEDGHSITLLCEASEGRPVRETVGRIDVVRVLTGDAYEGLRGWLNGARYLTTNVYPVWEEAIKRQYGAEPFDVLHVHDLPLVKTGLAVGDELGIPVVADLHENWPEAVRQYRTSLDYPLPWRKPKAFLSRATHPVSRYKRLERFCVDRADRVIAITDEGKEHYVRIGAEPDDVVVVSNYVDLGTFDRDTVESVTVRGDFVLTFVGTLSAEHRGLQTVVEAMLEIRERVPDPSLLIVGSGGSYEQELRNLSEELGVRDVVEFTGWVDFEKVPAYIRASDVGLVPHLSNPHTDTTVPHKLFQYMALGKPVIVSDSPPLRRIVTEAAAGLVFPSGDPEGFARRAIELYDDAERTAEMGANGRRAAERDLNWDAAGRKLCAMYEGLSTGKRAVRQDRPPTTDHEGIHGNESGERSSAPGRPGHSVEQP